jgi:hypothetical protein
LGAVGLLTANLLLGLLLLVGYNPHAAVAETSNQAVQL